MLHSAEMVNYRLKSLDELNKAEHAKSEAVIDVQAIGSIDIID
jgi:hypothetical protein